MTVICPKCRKSVEIDDNLRHCIRSVREVGCDDCLRKLAYEAAPVELAVAV